MTGRTFFPKMERAHSSKEDTRILFFFFLFQVVSGTAARKLAWHKMLRFQPALWLKQCSCFIHLSGISIKYLDYFLPLRDSTFPMSALVLVIILRNLHFVSFDFILIDNQSRYFRQLLSRLGCSSISPFPREFTASDQSQNHKVLWRNKVNGKK